AAGELMTNWTAPRDAPENVHMLVAVSKTVPLPGIDPDVVPAVDVLPASTRQVAVKPTVVAPVFIRKKRLTYPGAVNVDIHGDCRIVAFAPHVQYGLLKAPLNACCAPTTGLIVPDRLNERPVPSDVEPVAWNVDFIVREVPTAGKLAPGIDSVAGPPAGTV